MNVIGLDLSLTAPGLCVDDRRAETLHTDAKIGDKRFCVIRDWIEYYLAVNAEWPSLAVIEDVPHAGDQAGSHLQRVHGVAREILARHDIPFAYVNVTALKSYATGNGRADKSEVMDAVLVMTGWRPADDNQGDAWVLRRMGRDFFGRGLRYPSAHQRQAIAAVEWPLRPRDPRWPAPYGAISALTKMVRKKCRHGVVCLRNGDHWLHPLDVVVCDKPPKTTSIR